MDADTQRRRFAERPIWSGDLTVGRNGVAIARRAVTKGRGISQLRSPSEDARQAIDGEAQSAGGCSRPILPTHPIPSSKYCAKTTPATATGSATRTGSRAMTTSPPCSSTTRISRRAQSCGSTGSRASGATCATSCRSSRRRPRRSTPTPDAVAHRLIDRFVAQARGRIWPPPSPRSIRIELLARVLDLPRRGLRRLRRTLLVDAARLRLGSRRPNATGRGPCEQLADYFRPDARRAARRPPATT